MSPRFYIPANRFLKLFFTFTLCTLLGVFTSLPMNAKQGSKTNARSRKSKPKITKAASSKSLYAALNENFKGYREWVTYPQWIGHKTLSKAEREYLIETYNKIIDKKYEIAQEEMGYDYSGQGFIDLLPSPPSSHVIKLNKWQRRIINRDWKDGKPPQLIREREGKEEDTPTDGPKFLGPFVRDADSDKFRLRLKDFSEYLEKASHPLIHRLESHLAKYARKRGIKITAENSTASVRVTNSETQRSVAVSRLVSTQEVITVDSSGSYPIESYEVIPYDGPVFTKSRPRQSKRPAYILKVTPPVTAYSLNPPQPISQTEQIVGFDPSYLSPQEREGWERNQVLNKPGTVSQFKKDTVIIDPIWLISWRAEGDRAFDNKPAMKNLFYKTYPQLQKYQEIARYRSPETEVDQDLANGNLSLSNRQFDPSPLSPQEWKGWGNQESIKRETVGVNVSKGGRKRVSREKTQAEEAMEEFLRLIGEPQAQTLLQTKELQLSNEVSTKPASTGVIFHARPSNLGCRPSMYIVTSGKGNLILEQDGQREVIQNPENTFLHAELVYPLVPGTYTVVELMQYNCNGMGGYWRKDASRVFTVRIGEVTHVQLP